MEILNTKPQTATKLNSQLSLDALAALVHSQGPEEANGLIAAQASLRAVSENVLLAELLGATESTIDGQLSHRARAVLKENDTFSIAFRSAVEHGQIALAMRLIDERCKVQEVRFTHKIVCDTVKKEITHWSDATGTSANAKANLSLFTLIMKTGVVPSAENWQALKHFPNDQKFLLSMLSQFGESFGMQIIEELQVIFNNTKEIPSADQRLVKTFLQSGFRGFSVRSFVAFKTAYESSPLEAQRLIQGWLRASRSLLSGREVSPSVQEDPLYTELVMGAYRPARFIGNREGAPQLSVGDVTCILASATNCQGHLTPFVYPKHGYAVRLQAESGATEKSFNQAALGQCATIYQLPPSRELSPRNLAHEVLKILNGNSLQTDAAFIMAYVVEHSEANSDLASLIREVRESGSIEGPGKHTRELRLIFGDAFEDALEKLLPSIASSIELTPKIARLVQQLSSTPSRAATPQQLETLLALEIPKVFSRERALLRTSPSGADEYSGDSLRMYLTKVSHAFMARSSTALCTTLDTWSWNNPNFLQMVMVDHGAGRVVGNIQIHLTQDAKGERALLARLNPTEAFVDKVDKTALARGMLSVVQQFADDNNLPAYLAEQGDYRMLTNRNSFLPFLEAYFGERHEVVTQVTGSTFQNVRAMYRIRREKLWQEK